jgi:hypothetical protein
MANLVQVLDVLGKAHMLHSESIVPGDLRAVEMRKDMTLTLSVTSNRWYESRYGSGGGEMDPMNLVIVSTCALALLTN